MNIKNFLINILILLFILLLFQSLTAQEISYNQEFRVDSYFEDLFGYTSVCGFSDSGFVICWDSQDGSGNGVWAQLFDNSVNKIGSAFLVNSNNYEYQGNATLCEIANGKFVVCWESSGQDGSYYGIFAQVFDKNGNKIGTEFQVNSSTYLYQESPSISGLSNGGFVISWQSSHEVSEFGSDIYAQIFDNDGNKIGTEFKVNSYVDSAQSDPSVSGLTDGGFVVCWESYEQDGNGYGIYAQLYNNNGTRIGTEFIVNSSTQGCQRSPSVTGLADGGFVVCWRSSNGVQLFDNEGNKIGTELNVGSIGNNPIVTSLTNGGFVVCWEAYRKYPLYGIHSQMFDNNGNKIGPKFEVNSVTCAERGSISKLSNGGFVICWNGYLFNDYDLDGIFCIYYIKPIIHQLSSFSLFEPDYDSTIERLPVTFKWSAASKVRINLPWELEYRLYLNETEEFSNPQVISAIYDTTCVVDSLLPGQTYFWKVQVFNIGGDSLWSTETFGFFVSPAAQMDVDQNNSPSAFELFPNYPNPFNPQTTIRYRLPGYQSIFPVVVQIYDVLGRLIITLKNERQHPGIYNLIWDGRDALGNLLPSGIYFCQLSAGIYSATQKILLIR